MHEIPPKPSHLLWNDRQWQAIHQQGTNVLVSAGAGSGKTAVLVERLVTQILDKKKPINIDEVLVVTFTEAAASEMKQRIREKLNSLISSEDNKEVYQKQLQKLPTADISTFHAFCLKNIKKYYYILGIDPNIKTIDDDKLSIYIFDVMEKLFNKWYTTKNRTFLELLDYYSTNYKDSIIKNLILSMYYQIVKLPHPNLWIEEIIKSSEVNNISQWKHYDLMLLQIKNLLYESLEYFKLALNISEVSEGPYLYEPTLIKDIELVENILKNINENLEYDTLCTLIKSSKFEHLSRKKDDMVDEALKEECKILRKAGTKIIDDIAKKYFGYSEKENLEHLEKNKQIILKIYELTLEFKQELDSKKTNNSYIDFNDYEHLLLHLLENNKEVLEEIKKNYKAFFVDEYQDTNYMQEAILSLLNSEQGKLFMVGDVKQAIYRFRHSTPKLFKLKYEHFAYSISDKNEMRNPNLNGIKIDLNRNYRSRKEIIDFTNYIFENIMSEKIGEVLYDDNAKLNFGAEHYPNIEATPRINITTVPKELDILKTDAELETEALVKRINSLISGNAQVSINGGKSTRPIKYSDIAVLMRSYSKIYEMIHILNKYQIPYSVERSISFYETYEIRLVTSFLKLISNTLDEVSLVATMRSVIYNFTESELAQIRIINNQKGVKYYDIVFDEPIDKFPEKLQRKIINFRENINNYRLLMSEVGIEELLRIIYEQTGLLEKTLSMKSGVVRNNNLIKFLTIAKSYEEVEMGTIHSFVNYIKNIEKVGTKEQITKDENSDDSIKIMSFHKSKGLEFPYVFIVGLKRGFNKKDELETVLINKDLGIASQIKEKYGQTKIYYKTLYQTIIKQQMRSESLSEEMRMLYVAFTRAKEHLELIFTDKKTNKLSFYSWLETPLNDSNNMLINKIEVTDLSKTSTNSVKLDENSNSNEYDFNNLDYIMNFKYDYLSDTKTYAKTSIAKMKEQVSTYSTSFDNKKSFKKPSFLQSNLSATEKGTAVHKLYSYLDYKKYHSVDDIKKIALKMQELDIITSLEVESLDFEKIAQFFQTSLFKEMSKASLVETEAPFTFKLSANEVYSNYMGNSNVILQGIIDLLIVFDDKVYIIDFKTNEISSSNKLKDIVKTYELQMDIYKKAMKKIYKKKEVKGLLYFVMINEVVEI